MASDWGKATGESLTSAAAAWHNPWLEWAGGGCSLSTLLLFKGHREERLCHQSCELDLSGLVPCLFRNCGSFPASCFPGVILNSQPFVPRHWHLSPSPTSAGAALSPVQGAGWGQGQ